MLEPITDPGVIEEALARGRAVAAGSYDLSSDWLRSTGSVVVADESANHFDGEQCTRLENAALVCGVGQLIAVDNERALGQQPVIYGPVIAYALDATAVDLAAFSWECALINWLVLPARGMEFAVLCTVDEYFLVAGSRKFVAAYAGDLAYALKKFTQFVEPGDPPGQHRAVAAMSWIADEAQATGMTDG